MRRNSRKSILPLSSLSNRAIVWQMQLRFGWQPLYFDIAYKRSRGASTPSWSVSKVSKIYFQIRTSRSFAQWVTYSRGLNWQDSAFMRELAIRRAEGFQILLITLQKIELQSPLTIYIFPSILQSRQKPQRMQCKYVRESPCMSFVFHPKTISLFSLVHFKNRLRIIQQNLYTGLIMNDFLVPLRQQTLEVDNYTLCYNEMLDLIIFTLSNRILIYSLKKKNLLVVAQASNKNLPLYITRTVTKGTNLYFSATEQKLVYGINLQQCIKNAGIQNYLRYKISGSEAEIDQIAVTNKVLVALCGDRVMRVWDLETMGQLKGVAIQMVGRPTCFCFSKNDVYLLIGTSEGVVQAWDGESLGYKSIKIMTQKLCNVKIQSLSWFHYAGESHSLRFLTYTEDGKVKLYSFYFQKKQQSYQGRCTELSHLIENRHQILDNFMIKAHSFANFVFYSPGILLYMVDHHSLIYYPVVMKQPSASFQQLSPNAKKEIYYTRDILFMKGLEIKRVKDTIQDKISLQNDLQYKELKILRLDMRPWSNLFAPLYTKLMVVYYLNSSIRVITLSKLNLNQKCENLNAYKEYNGKWITFIGPKEYYQPFILIVQDDKQTITVLAENPAHSQDIKYASQQQKKYFQLGPGEIYTKKIPIKIQKLYPTPFRSSYVLLYQSDNLLRFSTNINYESQLINYDVYTALSLRIDYTDIILDVVWTHGGEIGAVLCLDKVVFVNGELKVMRAVVVSGYVVQGMWIGFTLLVVTRKDVQYFDILSKPQQAFCLENLEAKYLVMRVMADRILGAEKAIDGTITVKARYFKIMEPLISGYLNYQQIADIPVDQQKIKNIIECFAPYFIVSEEFISLLNSRQLSSISRYFLEGNEKMYSRPLRAKTLNNIVKIERFIPQQIWHKNKRILLDLYLNYEESKDSNDPYEVQKGKQYANKIKSIIGAIAFDSIKDLASSEMGKGISISNNFGEQSMYQLYYDHTKDRQICKMEIYPFKAENCGEWLGQFGLYLESKPYFYDEPEYVEPQMGNAMAMFENVLHEVDDNLDENSEQDEENAFKNLIVYFRCDDGKGQTVQDLSDYSNNGTTEDTWLALQENEPMQFQDSWGKVCPPQFSLTSAITVAKKLNTKAMRELALEVWVKPLKESFGIARIGKEIEIVCVKLTVQVKVQGTAMKFVKNQDENELSVGSWSHLALSFTPKQKKIALFLNSHPHSHSQTGYTLPRFPSSLELGDPSHGLEYTEVRLWRKPITEESIKQNMRSPLSMVAEKRKRLKMKLKEKKKKEDVGLGGINAFSLD